MTANNEHFYKTFQPSHYDLYIDVNRGTKVISGRTTISGEAKATEISVHQKYALMLDLRTDFSLPCKLIAEEHFLYDSIFTRI
ncbi:hypothetical protein HXX29_10870 [Weissella confusa]|nr:hypothetical protein [Weissella confusa]MBF7059272.1 hypothetical protein [Weissella confusa]